MHLVFGRDELVCQWVCERIGMQIAPPYTAIGGTRDRQSLCAGTVFNCWNGANIDITLATDGGLSRGAIRGIYHYMFVQLGALRATAHTRRSNKKMRELLPRLGFTKEPEGVLRNFYGPHKADDAFVFALFPENARKWL